MQPILFYIGDNPINSYRFFNALALLIGAIIYFRLSKPSGFPLEKRVLFSIGAMAGGLLGAKSADILFNFQTIAANPVAYLGASGTRTVMGGIIGGYLGVNIVKRFLGIRDKTGDPFALALSMAMGIGRIGCFMGGCCYGKPAEGWFTVFMEGANRYPTQLMEMAFDFLLFGFLLYRKDKIKRPGDLFKTFALAYASFRFLIEFIRAEPVVWLGLTFYQLLAFPVIFLCGLYFIKSALTPNKGQFEA